MSKSIDEMSPSELTRLRMQVARRVGKRLRQIRKSKGISQENLAHKAGLYRTYIGHVETGSRLPNVFTLWRIAKALNLMLVSVIC